MVLDASSLLAFLHDEPGADQVWSTLPGALVGAVNWLEVVQKSLQRQADITGMRLEFVEAGVLFVPFTPEHRSAPCWPAFRALSRAPSITDRSCLALAIERQVPVLTADRAWSALRLDLDIQFIR